MADLVYACRPHLFAGERTYELGADEMTVTEKGKETKHIPLRDVAKIALSYMGTGQGQTYCQVKSRSNGKTEIRSHHYVSLGNFENRHEGFDPFIVALCQRAADQNPRAAFVRGSWVNFTAWFIVFLLCAALALGMFYEILTTGRVETEVALAAAFACFIGYVSLGGARANRVTTFDPRRPASALDE